MCVRTDENPEVFVLCGFCRPGANARGKTCESSKKWRSATFSTLRASLSGCFFMRRHAFCVARDGAFSEKPSKAPPRQKAPRSLQPVLLLRFRRIQKCGIYGGHWDDPQVGKLCHSQHNQARQRPLSPLRARNPVGRDSRRPSAPVRVPYGIPAPCRAAALSRRAHFTPSPLYFRGIFDTIPMLRQPGGKVNFSC